MDTRSGFITQERFEQEIRVINKKINAKGSGGAGAYAPDDAQYVVLALDGDLSAERVLVAGDGLALTDGGADGNATLDVGAGSGLAINGNDVELSHLGFEDLINPEADRIVFWDDGESALKWLQVSTGLEIDTTELKTKDSEIDHDSLNNYDVDKHINWKDASDNLKTSGYIAITGQNELRFYEGVNYVGFESPALDANQIWVLPDADGNANEALGTDGSGNLIWRTHNELSGFIANEHINHADCLVSVYLNVAQNNLVNNTWTTVQLAQENFDVGSNFNTGTYTFTAPADGYYYVAFSVGFGNTIVGNKRYMARVYDGSNARIQATFSVGDSTGAINAGGSKLLYLSENDTLVLQALSSSGGDTVDLIAYDQYTYLTIQKVA